MHRHVENYVLTWLGSPATSGPPYPGRGLRPEAVVPWSPTGAAHSSQSQACDGSPGERAEHTERVMVGDDYASGRLHFKLLPLCS